MLAAFAKHGSGPGTLPNSWHPLPEELGRFIDAEVRAGRAASPSDLMIIAIEKLQICATNLVSDPLWISIQQSRAPIDAEHARVTRLNLHDQLWGVLERLVQEMATLEQDVQTSKYLEDAPGLRNGVHTDQWFYERLKLIQGWFDRRDAISFADMDKEWELLDRRIITVDLSPNAE